LKTVRGFGWTKHASYMQNDEYSDGRTEVKYPPLPILLMHYYNV
jgi:hypothetical protein